MTQFAGFDESQGEPQAEPIGRPYQARRRTAVRVLVPVAIAAVAATGVAVVPALASDSNPTLPQVTAEQLVTKVLSDQTRALSGTVKVSTDLGIPSQALAVLGHGGVGQAVTGDAAAAGGSGQARQGAGAAQADPQAKLTELLAGEHTLRVAVDGPDKQRVALIDDLAEYDLVRNGDQGWAYDSASNQAVHLAGKPGAEHDGAHQGAPQLPEVTTPQQAAQRFLADSAKSSDVSVSGTGSVAGRSVYQLQVKPKQSGSTIAAVQVSVDSATGTPLAVKVTTTSGATALDVHFSSVSFATPDAKTFTFTPPKGAKVTEQQDAAKQGGQAKPEMPKGTEQDAPKVIGEDWNTVVSFTLPKGGGESGQALGQTAQGRKGRPAGMPDALGLVKSLGKPVAGGTLISTKVLNVLITDDGHVYAGAVTPTVLQNAAGVK
jgi:outer membrane lipoprotein-sorting protein